MWGELVGVSYGLLVAMVQMKLQQLQQQCVPMLADAVCRYLGCLSHHTSSDIIFSSKGETFYQDVGWLEAEFYLCSEPP